MQSKKNVLRFSWFV